MGPKTPIAPDETPIGFDVFVNDWSSVPCAAADEAPSRPAVATTAAVVRISFSFMTVPLDPCPWPQEVYHRESGCSRERERSNTGSTGCPKTPANWASDALAEMPARDAATFWAHTASPPPPSRTPAGSRASSRQASVAPQTKSARGQ